MSPDWFDPLGSRGSKLDPFTFFADALKGEGVTGQSADLMATTLAKQLVGRRIEIDHEPPISATIERIDEVRPPPMIAATAVIGREVPMWESVAGQLADVHVGEWRIRSIDLQARSLSLVGPPHNGCESAGLRRRPKSIPRRCMRGQEGSRGSIGSGCTKVGWRPVIAGRRDGCGSRCRSQRVTGILR
jgi:hypothetical protein